MRRRLGEGGFFNLRVLIGLFLALGGVFLALLGLGAFSVITASSAQAQQKYQPPIKYTDPTLLPPGFDCSKIHELAIDRQDNMRAGAIMIGCGGGSKSSDPTSTVNYSFAVQVPSTAPVASGTVTVNAAIGGINHSAQMTVTTQ